jgi:hypothetical protein
VELALIGGGVGAGAGALLGGILGATIPADKVAAPNPRAEAAPDSGAAAEVESPRAMPMPPPPGRTPRYIASLIVQPGVGILTDRPGHPSEFMVRAALLAQLKPWFAIGPEFSRSQLSGGFTAVEGAIQVGPSRNVVYPYLTGDMGLQVWKTGLYDTSVSILGAGVGGGVSWAPGAGRWRLGVESRYQWSLQNIEDPQGYRFVFVGGTARVSW